MLARLVDLTLCHSVQLLMLAARGESAKDIEPLVRTASSPSCVA
jgi:hypothetical protein